MKKVTMEFKSIPELWEFKQLLKAHHVEINMRKRWLTCDCSDADVAKAIKLFNAKVVEAGK